MKNKLELTYNEYINIIKGFKVPRLKCRISDEELLKILLELEQQHQRIRKERWGPRTLDLDLLLYGNETLDTPELQLPHPRMHLRAFVLAPLLEIAPDCAIPGRGSAAAWLPAVSMQPIEKLTA